jgi:tetratricopeptide (TPR) repeat protein
VHLGNTLHLMGRDEEAISIYKMALRATRSEATRLHVSGMIAVCLLQYYDAIERFKKAASTEPRNAIHWLRVGMTYLSLRNPVRALQAFDEALNINPQDIMALSESYVALRALGCDEEARQRVEQVLKVCPGDVLALKRMADHRCRPKLVLEPEVKKTHRLMLCAKRTPPNATEIVGSSACYKSDRNGFFYDGASRSAINAFSQNPVLPEDIFRYQVAYEILTSAH